jgi:hypothetical protein
METVPRTKLNELLKSGVLRPRPELIPMFPSQSGGNYAVMPMTGRIGGEPAKYDGVADMPVTGLDTYMQGIVVAGFMKGWEEKDFTQSIAGKDFMADIARQVVEYWDDYDQKTLIAVLDGVFAMTGTANQPFINSHLTDMTGLTGNDANDFPRNHFNETTVNTATQRASGDNRYAFDIVVMHSTVMTNLENRNLLERLKYTDANGVQRSLRLGMLNGRTAIEDDDLTDGNGNFTTYLLGRGSIGYADVGVKVSNEVWRDPKTQGGLDQLLTRQRKIFTPFGISFTNMAMATTSPELSELRMGNNWEVVQNSGKTASIDHKAILISKVITRG